MLVQQRWQAVPKERCNVLVFPSPMLIGMDQMQNPDLNGQTCQGKTRHSVRIKVTLANPKATAGSGRRLAQQKLQQHFPYQPRSPSRSRNIRVSETSKRVVHWLRSLLHVAASCIMRCMLPMRTTPMYMAMINVIGHSMVNRCIHKGHAQLYQQEIGMNQIFVKRRPAIPTWLSCQVRIQLVQYL